MELAQIVAVSLLAVFIFAVSTALHEIAHILMCKFVNCRIIGWKILFINYDGEKVAFKLRGRNHCAFITGNKRQMRLIVLAGPIVELFIFAITLIAAPYQEVAWIRVGLYLSSILIGLSVVYNLLPLSNGDGKILFGKDGT